MNLDACVDWCHERMLSLYGSVVKPKAGALAFVRYLARTGISCCVLTAFKETMAKKLLADIEILPHVGLVDSVDDFSQESDWTECYARTAHKLVASPKDCVVVERALPAMRSAKAAGCTVWGIEESAQPDTVDAMRKVCNRYFSSFIQMQAHCMRIFA